LFFLHFQTYLLTVSYFCTSSGKIKLTQNLSCVDYGIYVATCLLYKEQCVGQTKNKSSIRWTAHQHTWHIIFDVSRVYANSLPQKIGKKQNQSVHTLHF